MLPQWLEPMRGRLERVLTKIELPHYDNKDKSK